MSCTVDHLVVAAASLDDAADWCERTLGVAPGPGGRHPLMGTHNRLLNVSTHVFPQAYLELVAIDPDAEPPRRARWFGLDDPDLQRRLRDGGPRLVHVVTRTTLLEMQRWGLVALGIDPGVPVAASRDTPAGRLEWRLLVRDDGRLPAAGALPTLIEWRGAHPTDTMPPSGVALESLTLRGVSPRAADVLRLRGVDVSADADGPAIEATFNTPRGVVRLHSGDPR